MKNGFIKVAAASPVIRVCDCDYNADRVIECIEKADALGVKVLAFPALTLTGVECRDLFRHKVLLDGAEKALAKVVKATEGKDMLVLVGTPVSLGHAVNSAAAAVSNGKLLAFIPQRAQTAQFIGDDGQPSAVDNGQTGFDAVPYSADSIIWCQSLSALGIAVELGPDTDSVWSREARNARAGATLIVKMADFPQTVYSTRDAELNAKYESRHNTAAVMLAAPGKGESSTDNSYSGLCLVAENGDILAETEGEDSFAVTEIDVEYLENLRRQSGDFDWIDEDYTAIAWDCAPVDTALTRKFNKHPHLPDDPADLPAYCERVLDIQVSALVKRMRYAGLDHCVVGISGGVDSTLAVMVSALAVRRMGLPSTNVVACTMPCFGTSSRTKSNAVVVAEQWGCEVRIIDISKAVLQHFDDIGHAHDDYSIAFENAQARERTQVLMDIANKVNGLDVGTEDLSEFVDGWCTFNGDHTSMYDVNLGLTKTQVRANVSHIAATTEDKVLKAALYDVLDCPVTPELLPIHDDMIEQKSEDAVGSYSLQDFFTHHILINGFAPSKVFRLAKAAYGDEFTDEELKRWLTSWCKRLFSQQFKRSCLMDGPAVQAFSVSPRTGFLIPSDGEAALFLKDLENI